MSMLKCQSVNLSACQSLILGTFYTVGKTRVHKSRDLRDLDRGHKDTPGDTFWMTWIYFLGDIDIDPFRVTFKFLLQILIQ